MFNLASSMQSGTARISAINMSVKAPILMSSVQLSTTPVCDRRMGKRIRNGPEWKTANAMPIYEKGSKTPLTL